MKNDIAYCDASDRCKKKCFCQRNLGNYTINEKERLGSKMIMMSENSCISESYYSFIDVQTKENQDD